MPTYRRTDIPDAITIRSIATVYDLSLRKDHHPVPDVHDFWELAYVEDGTFRVLVNGNPRELHAGECIIYPPLAVHVGAAPQDVHVKIISFESDSQSLHTIADRPIRLSETGIFYFNEAIRIGIENFRLYREAGKYHGMMLNASADPFQIQRMKKLFELTLISLLPSIPNAASNTCKNYDNRVKQLSLLLCDFLKNNIGKAISLEEMAGALSISVSQLNAVTKKCFGLSPNSYFISLKMTAAKQLIRNSELNFTEIAERLGFSTVHYFSLLFKKRTGMTPSEYAKMQNEL